MQKNGKLIDLEGLERSNVPIRKNEDKNDTS